MKRKLPTKPITQMNANELAQATKEFESRCDALAKRLGVSRAALISRGRGHAREGSKSQDPRDTLAH